MNTNGFIHRDVKPENILVDTKTDRLMLFDFGYTVRASPTIKHIPGGSPMFIPPEAYTTPMVTSGYDVWSLGIILFMAVYGTHPFRIATNNKVDYLKIMWPITASDTKHYAINSLISSMLAFDAENRPPISHIRVEIWKQLDTSRATKSDIDSRKRARC
jgi:serine/threonine protein kinase